MLVKVKAGNVNFARMLRSFLLMDMTVTLLPISEF